VQVKNLSDIGFQQHHQTTLWCDNQNSINLSKYPIQHQCSKQNNLNMHFIIKLIHDQVIEVLIFPTKDQVDGICTNSFTKEKFSKV
jgi:hypothetical protein